MTAHHRIFEIVSVGYERRNVEEFVELLSVNRVDVLVDVRLNPIPRKRGFSKPALTKALDDVGIVYRHERSLGNPKENRDPFRRGLQSARDRYVQHLQNGASTSYGRVINLAHDTRMRSCATSANTPTAIAPASSRWRRKNIPISMSGLCSRIRRRPEARWRPALSAACWASGVEWWSMTGRAGGI